MSHRPSLSSYGYCMICGEPITALTHIENLTDEQLRGIIGNVLNDRSIRNTCRNTLRARQN